MTRVGSGSRIATGGTLRRTTVLLSALLLAASAPAQYLETTINLPFGYNPNQLCYNPTLNRLYVGCTGRFLVLVLDAETHAVVDSILTGEGAWDMVYDPAGDKLYCTLGWDSSVAVIDGFTNDIVARVRTGATPAKLCLNPTSGKVYAANSGSSPGDSTVAIVDCVRDSLRRVVRVAESGVLELCHNPARNRVYASCWTSNTLAVLDGAGDTVLPAIPAGAEPMRLCYDYGRDKLYCARRLDSMVVIDGRTDSVIRAVPIADNPLAMCYNPTAGKVYCGGSGNIGESGYVSVVDCATDSVVAKLYGGEMPYGLLCDPALNKVYCMYSRSYRVDVIDGGTNAVIAQIPVMADPNEMAWNPVQSRVYVANYSSHSISVIRDTSGAVGSAERAGPRLRTTPATVVRGVLRLDEFESLHSSFTLLNSAGRCVMTLQPGRYDVGALAPGVYYVRERQGRAVRRAVVTR